MQENAIPQRRNFVQKSKIFIIDARRSFIGKKNGVFRTISAEKLGAAVLRKILDCNKKIALDMTIAGNSVGGGGNIARLMALYAKVDAVIPAITIDTQCSGGLTSVMLATSLIKSETVNCVACGGFDSTSTQIVRNYNINHPRFDKDNPSFEYAQFSPNTNGENVTLELAENVARKWGIKRQELDAIAFASHKKAATAFANGQLEDSALGVFESTKDESIRFNISQAFLDKLPVLKKGGEITAGNSCTKNDGAAFAILCGEDYLTKNNLVPKAQIIDYCFVAGNPDLSPEYAVYAVDELFRKTGLTPKDISSFEINEAFSIISAVFNRKYPKYIDRLNPLGGAVGFGHPYSASGTIILVHLLKSLQKGQLGICSIANVGGGGVALLVKKE